MDKTHLYIFDVDGTLTTTKSGETFRQTADDWEWLPGRCKKCAELVLAGKRIALATNQAGVAFPWSRFTEAEIQSELDDMAAAIEADYTAVCFSTPNEKALRQYFNANDPRRKPGPGMLLEILEQLEVAPDAALMIGDRPEDEEAAQAAGIDFQWSENFFSY